MKRYKYCNSCSTNDYFALQKDHKMEWPFGLLLIVPLSGQELLSKVSRMRKKEKKEIL